MEKCIPAWLAAMLLCLMMGLAIALACPVRLYLLMTQPYWLLGKRGRIGYLLLLAFDGASKSVRDLRESMHFEGE
jgi:hypothetical protein